MAASRIFLKKTLTCSMLIKRNFLISVMGIFVLIWSGCENNSVNTETDPDELPQNVSFSEQIQPIFNESCGGGNCHINRTTSGVSLDSYNNVMNSTGNKYEEDIIIPGEPEQSPLVDKIEANPDLGIRMPQGGEPLNREQIKQIKGWIAEGAQDN